MTESTKKLNKAAETAKAEAETLTREVQEAIATVPGALDAFNRLMATVSRHHILYGMCQHRAGFDKGRTEEPGLVAADPIDAGTALLEAPTDEEVNELIGNLRQAAPSVSDIEIALVHGRTGIARHQAIFALCDLEEAAMGVTDPETAAVLQARYRRLDGMIGAVDIAAAYHRGIQVARNEQIVGESTLPRH